MTRTPFQGRGSAGSFVRKAYAGKGDDTTLSRWVKVPHAERKFAGKPRQQWLGNLQNPAFEAGRSIFWRKGVKQPSELKNLLVSGHSNVKIGRDVRKGLFRGYWIYTLTLEERATCPRSCRHWTTCYGAGMPFAKRIDHTASDFLPRLAAEIEYLCNPPRSVRLVLRTGVLVRLHALGDFYSSQYVRFWAGMLRKYPNLAVFGYTANPFASPIGLTLRGVKREFGRRFAVRWSDGGRAKDCTVSAPHSDPSRPVAKGAFRCPEQSPGFTATGRPIQCATCGLCWSSDRNVEFMEH